MLGDSNTDVVAILCIFYYIVKTSLNPQWLFEKPLLAFLLPVALTTFRVSNFLFCLICILVLYHLLTTRKHRIITFILSIGIMIVAFWCIRNVIISGYLVYPFYQLDLFTFDWKVPNGVAALQTLHIQKWAEHIFQVDYIKRLSEMGSFGTKLDFFRAFVNVVSLLLFIIASCWFAICIFKKGKINKNLIWIYLTALICITFSIIMAPDFRFVNAYALGALFLIIHFMLLRYNKEYVQFPRLGKSIEIVTILFFCILTVRKNIVIIDEYFSKTEKGNYKTILYLPWDSRSPKQKFREYPMGEFVIYLAETEKTKTYDKLPATNPGGVPFDIFKGEKVQSIKTIEARGNKIEDGFRTKEEYIGRINSNIEKFETEYYLNNCR